MVKRTEQHLTVDDFADLHGVTPRTVRRWLTGRKPLPSRKRAGRIEIPEIVGGVWAGRQHSPGRPALSEVSPGLLKAQTRKALALAARYELQLERERGTLLEFDEVKAAWLETIAEAKGHLLGLPGRMAGRLEGHNAAEIDALLTEEVLRICGVLSEEKGHPVFAVEPILRPPSAKAPIGPPHPSKRTTGHLRRKNLAVAAPA